LGWIEAGSAIMGEEEEEMIWDQQKMTPGIFAFSPSETSNP